MTGYPPEDLLLRPGLRPRGARVARRRSRAATDGITALVGCPLVRPRSRERAARSAPAARSRASTASTSSRTTASSTSTATSPPAASSCCCGCGDVLVGPTICEDVWQPGPPATDLALAGAQLHRQPLRLAVPRRQGRGSRGDARHARARQRARTSPSATSSAARTSSSSTATRSCSTTRARSSRARPGSRRTLLVVDLDPTEAIGRRLRDVRRRELERSRDERAGGRRSSSSPRRERSGRSSRGDGRRRSQPELEQMRLALGLGLRDYVEKNGFATS